MDWLALIEILKLIGGAVGAIITIFGFLVAVTKKPKEWIKKIIRENSKPEIQSLEQKIDNMNTLINERLQEYQQANLCTLRHDITNIYETYRDVKKLPVLIHQDLCYLYQHYEREGGNSYVHDIYEEMKTWEIDG